MPNSRKLMSEKQVASERRANRIFKNKIKRLFVSAGFQQIKSENHHFDIGLRRVEIDSLFIDENILIVCEDTSTTSDIKSHIRKSMRPLIRLKK